MNKDDIKIMTQDEIQQICKNDIQKISDRTLEMKLQKKNTINKTKK
jgi:hypothetical protein